MGEILQIRGSWWLPQNSNNKLRGILLIEKNERIELELFGKFPEISLIKKLDASGIESESIQKTDIILGESNFGHRYTLFNCRLTREDLIDSQKYNIILAIDGLHFPTKEQIKFTKISTNLKYLEQWMDSRVFSFNGPPVSDNFRFECKKPSDVEIDLNESCTIRIRPSFSSEISLTSIKTEQKCYFDIEFKEGTYIEQFFDIIHRFQQFLSFVMIHPSYVTEINGSIKNGEDIDPSCFAELYLVDSKLTDPIKPKDLHTFDAIFTYPSIQNDIEWIIKNWFELCHKYKTSMDLYFASVFISKMYVTSNFLNKVQGLEVFHRTSQNYSDNLVDPSIHEMRIYALKEAIKKTEIVKAREIRTFIKQFNKNGNKPNLQQRLVDLLKSYPDIFSMLVQNFIEFSSEVSDNRNYHTHYDQKPEKKYATDIELYYFTLKLEAMLFVLFLIELGFNKSNIQKFLKEFIEKRGIIK
jgi:hypothetical protein